MRTKKINAIENEMISSETAKMIASVEKMLPVRSIQFIVLFQSRTAYCADRAELDQAIAREREMLQRGSVRVFKVERDIEW